MKTTVCAFAGITWRSSGRQRSADGEFYRPGQSSDFVQARPASRLAQQVYERRGLVVLAAGEEGEAQAVAERRLGIEAHNRGAAEANLWRRASQ